MSTVFIVSAPSGSGKSTLVRWLLEQDSNLLFSVSFTTRLPRGAEVEGVDYHYIGNPEFEQRLANDEFLEWARVFDHYYGTHRGIWDEAQRTGKDLVLDIDVQGAAQLKERIPDAVSIFILPPSREILEQRLRNRSAAEQKVLERPVDDVEAVIQKRLKKAADEIRNYRQYDYALVNDELERSKSRLAAIVAAERIKTFRMEQAVEEILRGFEQA